MDWAPDRITEIQERDGPGHLVTQFITDGEPELMAAADRTERRRAAVRLDGESLCTSPGVAADQVVTVRPGRLRAGLPRLMINVHG
jgi:hypothetical protein